MCTVKGHQLASLFSKCYQQFQLTSKTSFEIASEGTIYLPCFSVSAVSTYVRKLVFKIFLAVTKFELKPFQLAPV